MPNINDKTEVSTKTDGVLIKITNLEKHFVQGSFFGTNKTVVKAVDGVDLEIIRGETFGLVGESGCGKSTLGRTLIRMYDVTSGQIFFEGEDISRKSKKQLKKYNEKMQIIFQDPYSALNPTMNVSEIVSEPLLLDKKNSKEYVAERVLYLLEKVGMSASDLDRFPYEFSGGQRQRIGIARALSSGPEFILCDEPISALDVSIQAQVINLLEDFQKEFGLTYLFVAHDLSMVKHISDRIGVMYLGKIVEIGKSDILYENPLHPYTKALLSAIPVADPIEARAIKRQVIEGDPPSPINVPSGCRFHTRCPEVMDICKEKDPEMLEFEEGHTVACHLYSKN